MVLASLPPFGKRGIVILVTTPLEPEVGDDLDIFFILEDGDV